MSDWADTSVRVLGYLPLLGTGNVGLVTVLFVRLSSPPSLLMDVE